MSSYTSNDTHHNHNHNHKLPNILICGTPGTGKSSLASLAVEKLTPKGFKYVDVTSVVKEYDCHDGEDEEFDSLIVDDDKLLDVMEDMLANGGCIVDYHSCDFFPERWFELVLVLTTDTNILYDRLQDRGYNEKKINENMECEIMQIVLESAKESYAAEIVQQLLSNTVDDMESNVGRLESWVSQWIQSNTGSSTSDSNTTGNSNSSSNYHSGYL